jgi:hypothetical protein
MSSFRALQALTTTLPDMIRIAREVQDAVYRHADRRRALAAGPETTDSDSTSDAIQELEDMRATLATLEEEVRTLRAQSDSGVVPIEERLSAASSNAHVVVDRMRAGVDDPVEETGALTGNLEVAYDLSDDLMRKPVPRSDPRHE